MFAQFLANFNDDQLHICLTNFHLLIWLAQSDALLMNLFDGNDPNNIQESPDGIIGLLNAIKIGTSDPDRIDESRLAVTKWTKESTVWANVQVLAKTIQSGELG